MNQEMSTLAEPNDTLAEPVEVSRRDVPSTGSGTDGRSGTADHSGFAGGPRIRAGAIAWGLLVSVAAVAVLAIVLRPGARDAFIAWMLTLTPLTMTLGALLVLGGVVLVLAVLGLIRRAQRRSAPSDRVSEFS